MLSEYLMFVSQSNNNKYYKLSEQSDGNFLAEWGRVGASPQSTTYPMSRWESILKEKLGKGYTRVVGHGSGDTSTVQPSNLMIANDDIRELVLFLIKSAKQSISRNYLVSSESVTQAQIDEAQGIIGKLKGVVGDTGSHKAYLDINSLLEKLYRTIPRRMADTRFYFLQDGFSHDKAVKLLQNEQSLLDTLQSQVGSSQVSDNIDLHSLGLDIEVASQADRDNIAHNSDFKVSSQKIFKVVNKDTESRLIKGKTKLLYHGTKNENWLSVLQRGLLIRPSGVSTTGSMLGDGVYFADKAKKSIGYTSLRGSYWASGSSNKAYLALFAVNLGRTWDLLNGKTHSSWMTRLDQKQVSAKGYDTVFAKGGVDLRNNEYVIYDHARCSIRYLIELNS